MSAGQDDQKTTKKQRSPCIIRAHHDDQGERSSRAEAHPKPEKPRASYFSGMEDQGRKRTTRHPDDSATKPLPGAQKDHRSARHCLTVVIIITHRASSSPSDTHPKLLRATFAPMPSKVSMLNFLPFG
jgi:hypothetical protein